MAAQSICFQVIGFSIIVAFFFLLKYSIESFRMGDDKRKTILGFLGSAFLVVILYLLLVKYVGSSFCMLFLFLITILIPVFVLLIYYIIKFYDEYKSDYDKKRFIRNIGMIIVIVVLIVSSIYVIAEYSLTPNAEKRFVISLKQKSSNSSTVNLIIPNLEGNHRYFDVNDYKIVEGDGIVTGYNNSEYIRIETSSPFFKIKYYDKAKPFSEYGEEWEFPFDKINKTGKNSTIDIKYHSENNVSCELYLRWVDNYSSALIGGHWYDVESEATIKNKTEEIVLEVDKEIV